MNEVLKVFTDWFYDQEYGEGNTCQQVGENGVDKIEYHKPMGEGDRHFCDVYKKDKTIVREFNLHSVVFKNER